MFPLIRPVVRPGHGLSRRMVGPFGLMRDEVDSLMDRFLARWALPEVWFREAPAWEVTEAEKEVVFKMPLAGFAANEVELSVVGHELTLRADHRAVEGAPPDREAAPAEHIELTVTLPAGLDVERMTATFRNGLLEVHIPRVPAAVPRRIEVAT